MSANRNKLFSAKNIQVEPGTEQESRFYVMEMDDPTTRDEYAFPSPDRTSVAKTYICSFEQAKHFVKINNQQLSGEELAFHTRNLLDHGRNFKTDREVGILLTTFPSNQEDIVMKGSKQAQAHNYVSMDNLQFHAVSSYGEEIFFSAESAVVEQAVIEEGTSFRVFVRPEMKNLMYSADLHGWKDVDECYGTLRVGYTAHKKKKKSDPKEPFKRKNISGPECRKKDYENAITKLRLFVPVATCETLEEALNLINYTKTNAMNFQSVADEIFGPRSILTSDHEMAAGPRIPLPFAIKNYDCIDFDDEEE